MGAGVIDSDCRGELGVILFNFGDEDFVINMDDGIAQLIFEKIKAPKIKETNEIEVTGRGTGIYGSTSVNATERNENVVSRPNSMSDQMNGRPEKNNDNVKNEQTPMSQSWQIITAR